MTEKEYYLKESIFMKNPKYDFQAGRKNSQT
jgi:hypothetical protein